MLHKAICTHHLPPIHPFRLVVSLPIARKVQLLRDGNLRQTDILHHGPDNGQATGFRGEGVNLIRAPSNITKQAFNGIGATNVAMHDLWKGIQRQKMFFIFRETADRFWVAQVVFAFESGSLGERLLFGSRFPDPCQFCRHLFLFSMSNGVHEHSAACAPDSAGGASLERGPRRLKAVPHAHRSRSDPSVWPHDGADLVRGSSTHLCRAWRARS